MARQKFTWKSFLIRLVAALVLVFATYNPSEYSYYHWTYAIWDIDVLKALVGVVLIIGWAIFLRATFHSLGVVGTVLAIAFFGLLLWLVVDTGLVGADNIEALTYLVLIGLSGVLSTGLSWSHIRRRVTGQLTVDDDD